MIRKMLLILFIFSLLLSYGDELLDKYINEAKGFYALKNFDKAYSRIKFALTLYKTESEIPKDVLGLAENIYYEYIKILLDANNIESVENIFNNDPKYSLVARNSPKILQLETQYKISRETKIKEESLTKQSEEEKLRLEREQKEKEEREAALLEKERELERIKREQEEELARLERENEIETERAKKEIEEKYREELLKLQSSYWSDVNKQSGDVEKMEEELEKQREENNRKMQEYRDQLDAEKDAIFEKRLEDADSMVQTVLTKINEDTNKSSGMIVTVVILIVIIFCVIILGIIFINFVYIKNAQAQQQRYFEYSMRVIQQPQGNIMSLPLSIPAAITSGEAPNMKKLLPSSIPEAGEPDISRLSKIIETCKVYAAEIDEITHRKNCSKNVSELVYKISKHFGHSEYDSMIFFAVGLIYDIGFLNIDPRILEKPEISEDEFGVLKTHTSLGINMIHFIDEDLREHFKEGILKHHENLDGSGYPDGLKDRGIPYIARVIRVVESFISLISSRKYKNITDKETAVSLLIKEKEKYDKKIVEALNTII